MTEVFFITNRAIAGADTAPGSYTAEIGDGLHTGVATVMGVDIGNREAGHISRMHEVASGGFTQAAGDRLRNAKDILFFVHGFANVFPEAISRAAFNRDWFAGGEDKMPELAVVTFTWPSSGRTVNLMALLLTIAALPVTLISKLLKGKRYIAAAAEYLADQARARQSAQSLLDAMAMVASIKAPGSRVFLLTHSMGHVVLAKAMQGNPATDGLYFDEVFLCAADVDATLSPPSWLTKLLTISGRVHIYFSAIDDILRVGEWANGKSRLGQKGKAGFSHQTTPRMRFVDCIATKSQDGTVEGTTGHYYYRRIPAVRDDIVQAMQGGGAAGLTIIP